ncbi:MAG TPA: NIPSNAP family protein [Terriglobales bacterium]|nr:NIPSNAP family protein [Terriglobales bacterium]
MIYEIRTYGLKVGSLAEVEKRYGEAYEHRKKYSELTAFFHTEIGPLNEIIHIWGYESLEERTRIRAAASKDPNWPPKIQEFITRMSSEIVVPFTFAPLPKPGTYGPFYEFRQYEMKAGTLPDLLRRWEPKLPGRLALSPIALVGNVEFGTANRFVHIWPYPSLDARMATRKKAVAEGLWPPGGGADTLVTQATKIVMPSAFSPMQ